MARILTNSNFVMNHIYFPKGWNYKWPKFYQHLSTFQKEGKNKHDDAPDALTGIVEMIIKLPKTDLKIDLDFGQRESPWKV
jgi:predicted phage terminase large subunit-like protein